MESTMMPKVSAIIPVYKSEKYLNLCVQSVLEQTMKEIEVLLIDDGSPDNCPEICDEWQKKDKRVRVFHKENGGASSARNIGLKNAQGQYVAFVDSDDWIEKEMFADLYGLIEKTGADMAICEARQTEKSNQIEYEVWDRNRSLDYFFRKNGEHDTHSIWNRLIKKSALEGFSFIEGKMNEDVHACYCFAVKCEKTVFTNYPYYHYRHNCEGVTNSSFSLKKMDLIYIWDCVKELVEKETPDYSKLCDINIKRARFTLLSKMYLDGYDKQDEKILAAKHILKRDVRKNYFELMKWKMPLNRKILLTILVLIP